MSRRRCNRKAHSISRLLNQYGFRGSEGEAKVLLNKCLTLAKKNGSPSCHMIISSRELGFPKKRFEVWNIPDNKLIVVIEFGVVQTVKSFRNKRDKNFKERIEMSQKSIF